jgi:predicted dehydrogenase
VTGNFCGFKRARTDVGVMHTDGIHFLDLFNWLLDAAPVDVDAVCRDHFNRGLEDFAIALLTYPNGAVGKVEAGYIQPGRWEDKVVAGAMTTKEVVVVGARATAELDFESETLTVTQAHHEPRNQVWTPTIGPKTVLTVEKCDPAQMVARELASFLDAVRSRRPTAAGPVECGINLAVLMECLYESASKRQTVRTELNDMAGAAT